jgi:two-component system, OmpR family, phosphate regulon response regulator PhoB
MTAVVVAEDDTDVRELVAFKLEQAGFDVIAVEDGPSALGAVDRHRPGLVVLDVAMPGMSGLDVCRMLRSNPATMSTPIMMLTARAQERDVESGFLAGADDYLVKPFSLRELVSRATALVERSAARPA